mmetsp:Transcript_43973/g.78549  ORF Transcript_43973/g.78549 Transcript_43973/m.78549 type:complete len:222 (-) Transcript_43973:462-1127(-)
MSYTTHVTRSPSAKTSSTSATCALEMAEMCSRPLKLVLSMLTIHPYGFICQILPVMSDPGEICFIVSCCRASEMEMTRERFSGRMSLIVPFTTFPEYLARAFSSVHQSPSFSRGSAEKGTKPCIPCTTVRRPPGLDPIMGTSKVARSTLQASRICLRRCHCRLSSWIRAERSGPKPSLCTTFGILHTMNSRRSPRWGRMLPRLGSFAVFRYCGPSFSGMNP